MTEPTFAPDNDPVKNYHVAIDAIVDHPDNDNVHPQEQIEELRNSLRLFGQGESIAVQAPRQEGGDYLCVAGHGVRAAAAAEGFRFLRCDVFPADWSPTKIKAYLLASNRLAQKSIRNEAQTLALLEEIRNNEPNLMEGTGWTQADLSELMRGLGQELLDGDGEDDDQTSDGSLLKLIDITIAPPTHEVANGDVWTMGRHTLICIDVMKGWPIWKEYLQEGAIFCPYAGPMVALTKQPDEVRLVIVQPETYIAGHILDRYTDVHGRGSVARQD